MPLVYLLPLIILIEGFASIAIEILTIRQLLPFAGGSVVVTSLIIGIFLLSLALGYEKGGRVTHNIPRVMRNNFFIVAIWAGIGLSYIFIRSFFHYLDSVLGASVIYPLIIYLLIILAPMIYLLGQTIPITMNMVKDTKHAGTIAGKALGLSTIGSFLGAVFTTLVLMHFLGVAWTVFITFALLMMLALLLCKDSITIAIGSVFAAAATVIAFMVNVSMESSLFSLTTNHANYQVFNDANAGLVPGQKMLVINDVYSSFVDDQKRAFPYIEMLRKYLYFDLGLTNAHILVLGAGGFTLSLNDMHNNDYTYVDIDSRIREVVVPNFIAAIKDKLVINDARSFLNTTKNQYDVIVSDVYSDYKAIPAHLLSLEFMQSIYQHLTPDGYAIFNIIANPLFMDAYSKRIDNTIRAAFGNCTSHPLNYRNQPTNIIYLCHKSAREKDEVVYKDNLNNSTYDAFLG